MGEYKRIKKFKSGIKNQMDEDSYMFIMAVINAYVSDKLKKYENRRKIWKMFLIPIFLFFYKNENKKRNCLKSLFF